MKAIITKIESDKVWAKTVNSLGEKPKYRYITFAEDGAPETTAYKKWQQAESERLELPLHEDDYNSMLNCSILNNGEKIPSYYYEKSTKWILISDIIEVTREGNYFKIM